MLDKTWASEGQGFQALTCTFHGQDVRIGLGICMDINPYEFTAPYDAFELSKFWKAQNVELAVFCTNWCTDEDPLPSTTTTIQYWMGR